MDTQMQKIMDNQMQTGFIGFHGFRAEGVDFQGSGFCLRVRTEGSKNC